MPQTFSSYFGSGGSATGGGIVYTEISSDTTAVAGQGYIIDASVGPVMLSLPPTPSVGDQVWVTVASAANVVTIGRNGSTLLGVLTDLTIDFAFEGIGFVYSSTGWSSTSELIAGGDSTFGNVEGGSFTMTVVDYTVVGADGGTF